MSGQQQQQTHQQSGATGQQSSGGFSMEDIFKNPFVMAIAGFCAGNWYAGQQYKKEIDELKLEIMKLRRAYANDEEDDPLEDSLRQKKKRKRYRDEDSVFMFD